LKGARPVREGLHRDRLFVRTSMAHRRYELSR
jgi:hypothetical protein